MCRDAVVALISYCPATGDQPDRLEKTHAQRADLVVFPEICAYLGAPDAWVCEDLDGPTVTAMAAAGQIAGI